MKAQICPVCNGTGRYKDKLKDSTEATTRVCHGCNGRGWVSIGVEYPMPHIGGRKV
jgi:DnaJ-class molecular chaperone